MQNSARDKLFAGLAHAAIHHRIPILATSLLLIVIAGAIIPGLEISTSRHGLVEDSNPYQARLLRFFERFGDPNSPVFFVISGSTATERRNVVDELVTRFETLPELRGRVIARLGPQQLAEALLLQDPKAANELRALAPSGMNMTEFVEGGLPLYLQAIEKRLANLAAALQMQMLVPFGPTVSTERVNGLLTNVGSLAKTTEAYLAGENPWAHLRVDQNWLGMVDSAGYVVGQGNEYLLVTVLPEFSSDEVAHLQPIVEMLRQVRDQVIRQHTSSTIEIKLTGVPTLAVDEMGIITRGLFQSSIATGLGVMLLFLIAFRSVRQSGISAMPLVFGTILTLGFVRLTYGQLNLITSSFISVLLGLGIDFPVHFLSRFNEFRRQGSPAAEAIDLALARTGPGIMTGAFTTILAFMTTATTEFTAFAELGIITSVGLLIMLIATFFLLPTLLYRLESRRDVVKPALPGIDQVTAIVKKAPVIIIMVGLAGGLGGALALDHIRFNYRYFDFLPQETESAQALRMLEDDLAMGPTFANISASTIEEARSVTAELRKLPTVASVQTATDLLPELTTDRLGALKTFLAAFPQAPTFERIANARLSTDEFITRLDLMETHIQRIHNLFSLSGQSVVASTSAITSITALRDQLREIGPKAEPPLSIASAHLSKIVERAWRTVERVANNGHYTYEDIPPILRHRFVARDKSAFALYVYPQGNIWHRDVARRFARDLEEIDPNVSGFAITLHAHSSMILGGFKRAAIIATFLILALLLYDFRDVSYALLALLPTGLGWLWMLGVMAYLEISFNVANIIALPLVLGIGIDAGVHIMHRCDESAEQNGGVAQLQDLLTGTGSAVMLSSLTTMVGFAGLMMADYGAMQSLGQVMVIGIGSCLLACLLVLPAVLLVTGRATYDAVTQDS